MGSKSPVEGSTIHANENAMRYGSPSGVFNLTVETYLSFLCVSNKLQKKRDLKFSYLVIHPITVLLKKLVSFRFRDLLPRHVVKKFSAYVDLLLFFSFLENYKFYTPTMEGEAGGASLTKVLRDLMEAQSAMSDKLENAQRSAVIQRFQRLLVKLLDRHAAGVNLDTSGQGNVNHQNM